MSARRGRAVFAGAVSLVILAYGAAARAEETPSRRAEIAAEVGFSAGATAALAPAAYSAARLVGTSSGNLNTSALPALLIAAFVPPAIATGALALERQRSGETTRLLRTYLFSTGSQLLVLTAAFFAKAWVARTSDLLLLSAATGAACGGAATLGAEISF
jgi:hypothetical protein